MFAAKYIFGPAEEQSVSEGTASAQRILRTIPLKTCAGSGCNYPEGDCLGVCS